jgi:hypothetical protein
VLPQERSIRDQAIVDLLRKYRDLVGVSKSGVAETGRVSDSESRALYTPGGEWDKSGCDALDALLTRLREERPSQWWHVTERYLRCEVRVVRVKSRKGQIQKLGPYREVLRKGAGTRPPDLLNSGDVLVVVEVWSPKVRLERARRGVTSLAVNFPWNDFQVTENYTILAA